MESGNRADRSRSDSHVGLTLCMALGALILSASDPFPSQAAPNAQVGRDRFHTPVSPYRQEAASPTFVDVPVTHPHYDDIEALYRAGYTAGCSTDPLMYCPEQAMNRAESAVFVERGIHSAAYSPPMPTSQVFADLPLDSWAANWVNGLWTDTYTAGCGTNPLIYCPWQGHTRAEGCVFYLRMLHGTDFVPGPPASQAFTDVPPDAWYAGWVQAAFDAGLIPACETSPQLRFCPDDPLTRAMAAHMMVRAKGLLPESPEWSQFGHDPQHTSYTAQTVPTPWRFKWSWNAAGPDGQQQVGHLAVPRMVQPITGGGRIYMVAADTLFALDKAGIVSDPNNKRGNVLWQNSGLGTLSSTPVYANEFLYVASADNNLYKLNAATGTVVGQFAANSSLTLAPLFANGNIYAVSANGTLYSVNASTMAKNWEYAGGSAGATIPVYSANPTNAGTIIYLTYDLYVHAVNATTGARIWKAKPTPNSYECVTYANHSCNVHSLDGAQAENGWPVVADNHGVVFVRYRLSHDSMLGISPAPNTSSETRNILAGGRSIQPLFALKISDGTEAFIPAVLNSGVGDGGYLAMGPLPVVRIVDGKEVVYMTFRNGLTCGGCHPGGTCTDSTGYTQWCDAVEDGVMGEMVLDSSTVVGYQAGDFRFIGSGVYREGQTDIQSDETHSFTMSGDIVFHSHWLLSQNNRITDRGSSRGATFLNPITTVAAPNILWRQCYCSPSNPNCNPALCSNCGTYNYCPSNCPFNAITRYCSGGCYSYGDTRAYADGFYEYHTDSNGGSTGYTIVSDGLVLVKTNDGGLIVLENGNPTAGAQPTTNLAQISQDSPTILRTTSSLPEIPYQDAGRFIDRFVTATGTIRSAVNHLPKAIYLGFSDPHDGALLVRIFAKDLSEFSYDPMTLKGKRIRVTGKVTLYWPENVDPEIIVTDPEQIEILDP